MEGTVKDTADETLGQAVDKSRAETKTEGNGSGYIQ